MLKKYAQPFFYSTGLKRNMFSKYRINNKTLVPKTRK